MIIVTGGAGYIGSHAVELLLKEGREVAVIDNLSRGYEEVIEFLGSRFGRDRLKFFKTDLRNIDEVRKVFSEVRAEAVIHFAALCLVNESMEKPELYFENNVMGTLNLLRVMKENNCRRLVFSSTCAVYGQSKYLPVDEKHPLEPENPYGESKLMAERMIRWFGKIYDMNYVIFRYFNVAGASDDGSIGDSKKPSQLLVQNAVRGALAIEPFRLTCPKVETKDGTPIRDYINVVDLVEAHEMALGYLNDDKESEIFNLGTGCGNSVLEIVEAVKKITGAKFEIGKGEARKGEYAEIYANIDKVVDKLGWKPKRTLTDSVKSLRGWYKKHPNGWTK